MKLLIGFFLLLAMGCSKGGSGSGGSTPTPTPTPSEENLVISIDPNPGNATGMALGENYSFKLKITSTPPKSGVKIDISGINVADGSNMFSSTQQTSNATTTNVDLNLSGLKLGILYNVKVDVTSLNTSTNKTSISFKVARKS